MPIYEYRCDSCGQELEKLQRISEAPLVDCPECKQPALRRLISAAGFRLKGSGWYETDFKKGGKRNVVESASGGEVKPDKGGDASKPADSKAGDSAKPDSKSTPDKASKAESGNTTKASTA